MEISAEKTKLMTNRTNGIQRGIKVKDRSWALYLGAVVSADVSKPEALSRIAQATAAHTKLKPIWRDYKYLSCVYSVDRKICHEGHCSASRGLPSDAEQ